MERPVHDVPMPAQGRQDAHGRRRVHARARPCPVDSILALTPASALSIATVPGTRQTPSFPQPQPAVAGEGNETRHGRTDQRLPPTVLGTAQPRHDHQEDRQDVLNSTPSSPCPFAAPNAGAMVDLPRAPRNLVAPIKGALPRAQPPHHSPPLPSEPLLELSLFPI